MGNCCANISDDGAQNDPRFRMVLWVALLSNAAMFVVEIIASVVSGSVSLQADALDFFGDAANYAISLCVLGLSLRARSLAAVFKGATMAAFGVWVLGSAVYRFMSEAVPDAGLMGAIGALALVARPNTVDLSSRSAPGAL